MYVGVTNDLGRRMDEHLLDSKGAKKSFAGRYNCHQLVYYEYYSLIDWAIAREKQIKRWRRDKKEILIEFFNPEWRFLNNQEEILKGDLPVWTLELEEMRPF